MQNFGQVSFRIVDSSGYSKCKMKFKVNFENVKYSLVKIEKGRLLKYIFNSK